MNPAADKSNTICQKHGAYKLVAAFLTMMEAYQRKTASQSYRDAVLPNVLEVRHPE